MKTIQIDSSGRLTQRRKSDRIAKKCFSRFKNTCTSPVEVYSDESSKKSNNDEGVSSEQDEYYEREKQRRKKKKVICISSSSGFKGKGVESKRNVVGIGKKVLKRQREDHLTRRRGTKKKQKIDEEDVSDLDVEWFSIVNRCSPKQFVNGLGILKPKQRKAVEDMGFGKLLHFKVNGIPLKIGHYVVDKLDVSTMQILGRQGPVEVNQDAVFRLLGIPNRGIDLKNVNPTRNLSTKLQEWRKLYPNEYISPSELVKRIGEAGDDDSFTFKVDFLMLFVSTMVECHAHGKCKIDVLNYMGDETDISKINWCSYVVDCIERCKLGWLPNTKSPFKGALTILTLLYVDNVECQGMNVDHTIPPIEFWSMDKLKQREVLEIKVVSESGKLGTLMDLDRMLEQTMSNKKKMELAIVKKFQDEPNNDMVRVMAIKYERIFNEKPCVVEGLKEKEVQKNNDETCQASNEVFDTSLADDIDETIMGLCLEINKRRQRWIESEDKEDPVDLGKVDTTIRTDQIVNKSDEPDLGCPSFSLGFTQTQAEKEKEVEQSDKNLDIFPGFNVGVTDAECKDRARFSGTKVSVDKERINLNRELLNEELPSFSLGLTQESNEEGSNQIKEQIARNDFSEKMNMHDFTPNITVAGCKLVGRTKAEILAEKQAECDRKRAQQSDTS
ncbi:hypothetical protein R6Q59_011812 [Mikania micrantha]